ncbi:MAG TPA: hypothetical protein VME46_19940 [Acidimicrobiales bacterium]|nr:hypothetical protein [Acidimicrobiales bacterium]
MATETRTLHFSLGFLRDGAPARLHVGRRRHTLRRHTEESRTRARVVNPALRLLADHQLTHFVEDVELPSDQAQMLLVSSDPPAGHTLPVILLTKIHVPRAARATAVRQRRAQGRVGPDPVLRFAGASQADAAGAGDTIPVDVDDWVSALDAAVQCIFMHAELCNIGAATAATVIEVIKYSNGTSDLATVILQQAEQHQSDPSQQNWVYETPYSMPDGSPSTTMRYVWSDVTLLWMPGPMKAALQTTKNMPSLESSGTNAGCYTVQSGVTTVGPAQTGSRATVQRRRAAPPGAVGDGSGASWTVNSLTPQNGFTYNNDVAMTGTSFSASFTNSWLRWLSGYVEFLGPGGEVVAPSSWTSQVPARVAGTYDSDTKKFVALYSSVDTILAIPVGGEATTVAFDWPDNASGVRLLAGGIGRTGGIEGQGGVYYGGWDGQVCAAGAIMTGVFNFGIPATCLLLGATIPQTALNDLAKSVLGTVLDIGIALVNGPIADAISDGSTTTVLLAFADAIPHLLLDAPDLVFAIDGAIAEEAVEESTPIFGWIALGVSVLTTVASLLETTAEVVLSPAVFELVATAAIDAQWTLLPDVDHPNTWPLEATHYVVTASYADGTTRVTGGALGPAPQQGPIVASFDEAGGNQLPAGGTVQFTAAFYSDTDWLCGAAVSPALSAAVDGPLVVPTQHITEFLVPISASTRYEYQKSLSYGSSGQYAWADSMPQATVTSLDPSNTGATIGALGQITVNQPQSQVAYDWQASGQALPVEGGTNPTDEQLYVFQTISTLTDPGQGMRFVPFGFVGASPVGYGLSEPATGNNFYLDPAGQEFNVRQIVLDGSSGTFVLPSGQSFGRFNEPIDACCVHPSGFVVGVSTANARLELLRLPAAAVPDASAPLADIYGGYGARPGLLHQPVGVAAAVGSGVIVLENADSGLSGGDARLQAFDLQGNPAPIFARGSSTALLHPEQAPVTALAVATESKGFIYVLKYLGEGAVIEDYALDIYAPDGTFLSQTIGLASGSIAVDLWRTVYTLDYQQIAKPAGLRPEPSVSFWTPSTPS